MFKQPTLRYVLAAAVFCMLVLVMFASRSSMSFQAPSILSQTSIKGYGNRNVFDDVGNTTLGFQKVMAITMPQRTDQRDGIIIGSTVTNLHVDFVDGVRGDSIAEKAFPPGKPVTLKPPVVGAWRAHIDAISDIVHNNITSALIMEGDVDWDVRVHSMARDFAMASTALLKDLSATIDFRDVPTTAYDQVSPYGDGWDVLWLGHCGMSLPSPGHSNGEGRVIQYNDPTVPETQYLHSWDFKRPTPLMIYPNHTRVVTHESKGVCSLAYAISQAGARKLLYNLGVRLLDNPFDLMLKNFCEEKHGNEKNVCLSAIPQLFDSYRPAGSTLGDSDMRDKGGFRAKAVTRNLRWSVRMNMERILRGETEYDDQYPDKTK